MMSLAKFGRSLAHALRGVRIVFWQEQSFRIQCIVGALVIAAAFVLEISTNRFIVLLLLIGSVLVLELLNSIVERLVDLHKPRLHPAVKDMKDMMAGVVLVASVVSLIVGGLIFYPAVSALFSLI